MLTVVYLTDEKWNNRTQLGAVSKILGPAQISWTTVNSLSDCIAQCFLTSGKTYMHDRLVAPPPPPPKKRKKKKEKK